MDPNEDIAEERLLRVIEGGGRMEPDNPKQPKRNPKEKDRKQKSGSNPFSWIKTIPATFENVKSIHFDLHFTNTALWVVLALIGIYLIGDFLIFEFYTKPNYALRVTKPTKQLGAGNEAAVDSKVKLKPLAEYASAFQDRDPFTGVKQQEEVVEEVVETPKTDPNTLIQGLSLVGINKGAQPEAFIEDTVQKKTYFVKAGQKVKELTVKEVQADGVVFVFEDQEVKLSN